MKRTFVAMAAVLAMATAAMAVETPTTSTPDKRAAKNLSIMEPEQKTFNDLSNGEKFKLFSYVGPGALLSAPAIILATPHFGVEWANDSAAKIPNEAGRKATQLAIAPFRLVGVILAGPLYLLSEVSGDAHAVSVWAGM